MSRGLPVDAVTSLPGAAAAAVVARSERTLCLTVIVKATFAFASDAPMPLAEPQGILRRDVHHGKSPAQSVRYASDLAPYLGLTDVTFTGYGYSHGTPVDSLSVRIAIFDAERTYLNKGLLLRDPKGFVRMPLVYERAYGGPGYPANPLGVGFEMEGREPTILHPKARETPAGFGPISRIFPARKKLLGSTPASALANALEAGFVELPDDFDWSYFQAAPPDQQIAYLRGDEWIALDGLHPTLPRIQMQLPEAHGRAFIYGLPDLADSEGAEIDMHADTLRIDGSDQRCTVVWRGRLNVEDASALASIRVAAGVEITGRPLVAPQPPVLRSAEDRREPAEIRAPNISLEGTMSIGEEDMEIVTLTPSSAPPFATPPAPFASPPSIAAPSPASATDDILEKRFTGAPLVAAPPRAAAQSPAGAPRPQWATDAKQEGTAVLPLAVAAGAGQRAAVPFRAGPVSDAFARSGIRMVVPALPVGQAEAASVVARWRGDLRVTAIAKATFAFAQSGEMPLIAPATIVAAETHHDQNPTRSVRVGSDLAPYLERVDVLFSGHAYAPPNHPEPRVPVRLALSADSGVLFDKRLIVLGDRTQAEPVTMGGDPPYPPAQPVTMGGDPPYPPAQPAPFQKMPLVYERTFGGIGFQDNPIGVGFDVQDGTLPNIAYDAPASEQRPAGFGPISAAWLRRRQLLRGHPMRLLKQPIIELPDDFAWSYFQAAPEDQQIPDLPARPWIVLEGLHPQHSMLQMRLPQVRAVARLHAPTSAPETIVLRADTLFIDGDAERCTLTFRGTFRVASADALEGLCILAGVETRAQPLAWPRPPSPAELTAMREPVPRQQNIADTVTAIEKLSGTLTSVSAVPKAPPLPFAIAGGQPSAERGIGPKPPAPIPGAPWSPVAAPRPLAASDDLDSTLAFTEGVDVRDIIAPKPTPPAPVAATPPAAAAPTPPAAAAPTPPAEPVVEAAPVAAPPREPAPPPREPAPPPRKADPWAKPLDAPSAGAAPAAPPKASQPTKFDAQKFLYGGGKKRVQ